jgi:hypothetical protein
MDDGAASEEGEASKGDASRAEAQVGNAQAGGVIVTLADFEAADWEAPIREGAFVDCHDLSNCYHRAKTDAEARGDVAIARAYRLLACVCDIMLTPEKPGAPFQPVCYVGPHARSATACDYERDQSLVFESLALLTQNPGLRARLADIAWHNRRAAHGAARTAIAAYRAAVEGLAAGTYEPWLDRDEAVTFDQVTLLHRALQIHRATSKDKTLPADLAATVVGRYEAARDARVYTVFNQLVGLVKAFALVAPDQLAIDAEAVGDAAAPQGYHLPRKSAYEHAADAWRAAGDKAAERRCRLKSVDLTLGEVPEGAPAVMRAHALREAIAELRAIPDTRERRVALEADLRAAQADATHLFTPIQHATDITDLVTGTLNLFEGVTLPDALLRFGFMSDLVDYAEEKTSALASARQFPLSNLFGEVRLDRDGKVVAQSAPIPLDGEPDEDWYMTKLNASMTARRGLVATAMIEPARQAIVERLGLQDRHFGAVCLQSPFIPREQAEIFARGFAAFFQGDYLSAVHLLLPQMEGSVRHVLTQASHPATIIQSDMTQEDRSMSAIFETMRPALLQVFGEPYVLEIDTLFLDRRGPALRHVIGHGKLAAAQCYGGDAIYGCWLIWRLACEPLVDVWAENVAPHIEGQIP